MAFRARAQGFFADHGINVERVLTDNGYCYRLRHWGEPLVAYDTAGQAMGKLGDAFDR